MKIIADLHIHSKYSRACSRDLNLENIDKYCQIKGVNVIATGDFTHPEWFKELKDKLIEKEDGFYVLKSKVPPANRLEPQGDWRTGKSQKSKVGELEQTRFICATEISCIYSKGGKCRRLHIVILAPNLEVVEKINKKLGTIGNLKADGRPILGLDVEELAKICLDIDWRCMIIPAHIWTPWFAMFGSKSGFDSIEEAFGKMSKYIYAVETGLSSDPQMNWRVKNLDKVSLISNSDAHSLPNIAREANVFEIKKEELSYNKICEVIKKSKPQEFLYTVEFYPEEGLYYIDGHRDCNFSCLPNESKKYKNICPVCKKPLVIGVLNRVTELAEQDRIENYFDKNKIPFKKLIELDKIIAAALGIKFRRAKKVQMEYEKLINNLGTEFKILLEVDYKDLSKITLPNIVEGIKRVREGQLEIIPGFDGQYGQIKIFKEHELNKEQIKLF